MRLAEISDDRVLEILCKMLLYTVGYIQVHKKYIRNRKLHKSKVQAVAVANYYVGR